MKPIQRNKDAFVIVDVQNDFCSGGALAVPHGEDIVLGINSIRNFFDCVVLTQDWHPAHHKSFASQHPGKVPGDLISLGGVPQVLWPVHCVQNTHGSEFRPDLHRQDTDFVFQKGTHPEIDSYSAFFDNARMKSTGLSLFLKEKGMERIFVAGLATDYCVKFTALDGLSEGFQVVVLSDLCRGVNLRPQDSTEALKKIEESGGLILESSLGIQAK